MRLYPNKIVTNTKSGDAIVNIMIDVNEGWEYNDEICIA